VDQLVRRELLVQLVEQDRKDQQVFVVWMDQLVQLVQPHQFQDPQVLKEIQVQQALLQQLLDLKVHKVFKDQSDQLVKLVHKDLAI
jgi:hypothetical protein